MTPEITYYIGQLRTHERHGVYMPLPLLHEISEHPDREAIFEQVFAIIDTQNKPIRLSYPPIFPEDSLSDYF